MSVRWVALGVMVLASALNYLDRQLLAAAGPAIISEFHLTGRQFGFILSMFSIIYATSTPFAGFLIDRIGLARGMAFSVGAWSFAGVLTGLTTNFPGLLAARAALGISEAAALPGNGKANATYLQPREFALGTAFNQMGLSLGSLSAPLIVAYLSPVYGWRSSFVLCGALGFVWIPLWLWIANRAPKNEAASQRSTIPVRELLGDRRLWGLIVGNALVMVLYTLWTNWTTLYFVKARGLSPEMANQQFAWIPPVFATLGGFAGGTAAYRLIRSGLSVYDARIRICWIATTMTLVTAAVPYMPSPAWAAAAISLSFFSLMAASTNIYSMPIDFFGPQRAAIGVSSLTFGYGVMQTLVSPVIGEVVDRVGFSAVCIGFALMPPLGVAFLNWTARSRREPSAS